MDTPSLKNPKKEVLGSGSVPMTYTEKRQSGSPKRDDFYLPLIFRGENVRFREGKYDVNGTNTSLRDEKSS